MYDLALVKNLCQRITTEQDARKVQGLLNLLRAAIRENNADARLGLGFAKTKLIADPSRG
jgi:hypothetical protein